jgi:protein-tyrosine phosphatase
MSWYRNAGAALRPAGRPGLSALLPNLLVGEYPAPRDAAWLKAEHGVTAVLSLQDDADLASKNLEIQSLEASYRESGIRFHRVPVPDCDTDVLRARLDEIIALLRDLLASGERVYLHCNGGLNRAPTVAIGYLHVHQALPLGRARDLVKQCRPCAPYMRLLEARFGRVHEEA